MKMYVYVINKSLVYLLLPFEIRPKNPIIYTKKLSILKNYLY
jgi:hypothetical protein